jgi:hypothetical protein
MLFKCCMKRIVVVILTLSLFACGSEKTDEITINQTEPTINPTSVVIVELSVDVTNNIKASPEVANVNFTSVKFVADSTISIKVILNFG